VDIPARLCLHLVLISPLLFIVVHVVTCVLFSLLLLLLLPALVTVRLYALRARSFAFVTFDALCLVSFGVLFVVAFVAFTAPPLFRVILRTLFAIVRCCRSLRLVCCYRALRCTLRACAVFVFCRVVPPRYSSSRCQLIRSRCYVWLR